MQITLKIELRVYHIDTIKITALKVFLTISVEATPYDNAWLQKSRHCP